MPSRRDQKWVHATVCVCVLFCYYCHYDAFWCNFDDDEEPTARWRRVSGVVFACAKRHRFSFEKVAKCKHARYSPRSELTPFSPVSLTLVERRERAPCLFTAKMSNRPLQRHLNDAALSSASLSLCRIWFTFPLLSHTETEFVRHTSWKSYKSLPKTPSNQWNKWIFKLDPRNFG